MNLTLKCILQIILSLILLGCAHIDEVPKKDIVKHEIGNGWDVQIIAPQFEVVEDLVRTIHENPSFITIPAEIEWVKSEFDNNNSKQNNDTGITVIEVIPATYEDVTDNIIVEPARIEISFSEAVYDEDGFIKQLATFEEVEIPAVKKPMTRSIVKTPTTTVEVPLEPREGYVPIVKTPARTMEDPNFEEITEAIESRRVRRQLRKFIVSNKAKGIVREFENFDEFTAFLETIR